jgi:hypothetical protein
MSTMAWVGWRGPTSWKPGSRQPAGAARAAARQDRGVPRPGRGSPQASAAQRYGSSRSFRLNFELNVEVYDPDFAADLNRLMQAKMEARLTADDRGPP